jgi:uncharacterized small protein (DUF1192 family)
MPINPDEIDPVRPKPAKRNLEIMSVDELEALIAELEGEITRIRQAIAAKHGHRNAADAFFKRP